MCDCDYFIPPASASSGTSIAADAKTNKDIFEVEELPYTLHVARIGRDAVNVVRSLVHLVFFRTWYSKHL
jgi:hypothetical protein